MQREGASDGLFSGERLLFGEPEDRDLRDAMGAESLDKLGDFGMIIVLQ